MSVSFRTCTPMPGVVCGSMVQWWVGGSSSLVCIRVVSLAHCLSFLCWRCFRVSSAVVYHGRFSTLMTWCSSQTTKRSVSLSSRRGELAWKAEGFVSTWRSPSFWSLAMAMKSSRNLFSTSLLFAVVVSAENPTCAHSVWCGSTRCTVA